MDFFLLAKNTRDKYRKNRNNKKSNKNQDLETEEAKRGPEMSAKILDEAGKQELLQQMFQKFYISNRLSNRYFPKIAVGCP